ncbi:hypothetical protein [Nonomuraea sp. NPDC050310]|uniref:hypothetical protein n=1 Tax=unclassified Nonomuraea TaxID=2593643 RepID=UPI0033C69DB8
MTNQTVQQPPPPKSGKSSKVVKLTIVGAVGVLLIGFCAAQMDDDEEVTADCVDTSTMQPDGSYAVVDDDFCDTTHYRGGAGSAFLWYYAGTRIGARVARGTTIRPSGVTINTRQGTTIQRGGFGGRGGSGS